MKTPGSSEKGFGEAKPKKLSLTNRHANGYNMTMEFDEHGLSARCAYLETKALGRSIAKNH